MKKLINSGRFSSQWDEYGNLVSVLHKEKEFIPAVACTYFEIDEAGVEWELSKYDGQRLEYVPIAISDERASLVRSMEKLPQVSDKWGFSITGLDGEMALKVALQDAGDLPVDKKKEPIIGMTFTVPDSAVIHLADHNTVGRRIDKDMALEHVYSCNLTYNLMIIELDGLCIRMRTEDEGLGRTKASVRKHDDTFTITFSWRTSSTALVSFFSQYDEAISGFIKWIEEKKGMRKLKSRKDVPEWIHDIKLIIFCDLILSNWKITYEYKDIVNMARDVSKNIDPKSVMIYMAGWAGAFDACEPAYIPAEELGGEAGFKQMMDQLHKMGFKVMVHTTVWGIDPYVEDIEGYEKMAVTKNGKITAWQICRERADRMVPFYFRTPRIPLKEFAGQKSFKIPIGYLPGDCYLYYTIGGVSASKGRIRLNHDKYPVISPTGWFEEHDLYDYIYPVYYTNGQAEIEVQLSDDAAFNLENVWIQVRYSTTYANPYSTWSHPMLRGSPRSEEYNRIVSNRIAAVVKQYGIDAVHTDAACFYGADGFKETIMAITGALPEKTLIQCEFLSTWEEMDFWMFCFIGQPDMLSNQFPGICVREHGSPAMLEGAREFSAWMDKTSPICDFVKDYIYQWSPGNAFVPVSKVTDICNKTPRKLPYYDSETWLIFRNARKMRQISSLRINYRDYGLDSETIKALNELNNIECGSGK